MFGPPHPGASTYALSEVASSSTFEPKTVAQNVAATTASRQSKVTLLMKVDMHTIFPHAAPARTDMRNTGHVPVAERKVAGPAGLAPIVVDQRPNPTDDQDNREDTQTATLASHCASPE